MNTRRKTYFQPTSVALREMLSMKGLKPLKDRFLQREQRRLLEKTLNELFSTELMSHIQRIEIKNYHTLELHINGTVWYQGMLRNFTSIERQLQARHSWIRKINISIAKQEG